MFFMTLDHLFKQEKEEGKLEGKIEIAKKMLKKGSSVEDIAEITELTIQEIEKIKEELN